MLYAVTTHEIEVRDAPGKARSISMKATLTIEKSRVPMYVAVAQSQNVVHGPPSRRVGSTVAVVDISRTVTLRVLVTGVRRQAPARNDSPASAVHVATATAGTVRRALTMIRTIIDTA
jgi:hypothetical protein